MHLQDAGAIPPRAGHRATSALVLPTAGEHAVEKQRRGVSDQHENCDAGHSDLTQPGLLQGLRVVACNHLRPDQRSRRHPDVALEHHRGCLETCSTTTFEQIGRLLGSRGLRGDQDDGSAGREVRCRGVRRAGRRGSPRCSNERDRRSSIEPRRRPSGPVPRGTDRDCRSHPRSTRAEPGRRSRSFGSQRDSLCHQPSQ